MKTFCLLHTLIPKSLVPHQDYEFFGSRTYTLAPKGSDYDLMFQAKHRDTILEHLKSLGVEYASGARGPIKFKVSMLDSAATDYIRTDHFCELELNFCFIEDFDAWQKATNLLKKVASSVPGNSLGLLDKKTRITLFEHLVEAFGGARPKLPNGSSSPL